jgi:hypothetical protein
MANIHTPGKMDDRKIVECWLPKRGCTTTPWEIAKPGDADEAHRALRRIVHERDQVKAAASNYLTKISDPMCPPAIRQVALDALADAVDA